MDRYVKVKDVMEFINSSNRGSEDYFIVDQIEGLCKNKAKTLEELKIDQETERKTKTVIAAYYYEHNDGDQIWEDISTFYKLSNGKYCKEFYNGYSRETDTFPVTYEDIVAIMSYIERELQRKQEALEMYGTDSVLARGGYMITVPLQQKEPGKVFDEEEEIGR